MNGPPGPDAVRTPFVWPPGRSPPPASTPAPAGRPRRAGAWRQVEDTWLGLVAAPLEIRAAADGWSPDLPTAYCARCGRTTGPYDADAEGCVACRGRRLPWDGVVRVGEFRGLVRTAVHELKFGAWRRVGQDLGRLLGDAIAERLWTLGISPTEAVVVPVPTTFRRRVARGIDHSLVIARAAAARVGSELVPALAREHVPPQVALAAAERGQNVRGTMWRRPGFLLARGVVLVDDVMTTGATMAAAGRGLVRGRDRRVVDERPEWVLAAVAGVTALPGTRPVVGGSDQATIGAGGAEERRGFRG